MHTPKVSIGFPVYNGENYVEQAIRSILNQTYKDFELIISDNASTDHTSEVCNTLARNDSRVRYFLNNKNMGAAWNFNKVFHLSKGKYFIWACHDDVWNQNLLERYVEVMEKMPKVVSCYSKTTFINENGEAIYSVVGRPDLYISSPHERFKLFLKYHSPTNECSQVLGLFRSEMLKHTPLMGKYPSPDMILLGEIAIRGPSYEVQDVLLIRRDHPLKSTNANRTMEEKAAWLDPRQKGRIQLTTCRWIYELHKSVIRSPVNLYEKVKCVKEVWKWGWLFRSGVKKEMRKYAKKFLRPNA